MLSEIKLPVVHPIINGYSHFGSVFSIIGTDEDSYIPWFLSRFGQLFSDPVKKEQGFGHKYGRA
ncbi:hypothetical protein NST41_07420 [Paenibacillus sp. FSL L8-0696]|uniref:hypothetical protein n=1 Tax=Paenibacillus sp. FSL L8-0696 TaxID=2954524 RepID=UPI003119695F